MEPTVTERPFSQEQQFNQPQSWHNGTMNSNGTQFQQDPSQSWRPMRWKGTSSFSGDDVAVCRDNLRGKCARGASCKFRHSEFVENDGFRYCRDEQRNSGPLANSGNSKLHGENKDDTFRTGSFSRECRKRSPCRKFQRGSCHRGASCPYLHPEFTKHDRPVYDRNAVQHHGVGAGSRNPGFCEGNMNNVIASHGHDESNRRNDLRLMSLSREHRSRSPCRNFLEGKCRYGDSCLRPHIANAYVRSKHDLSTQQHPGVAAASGDRGFSGGRPDISSRTSQECDGANQHNDSRTGSFAREPRSRSPCRNFLRGKCYRGSSCPHLHPVTRYERTRYDSGTQQHQGVTTTSRNLHFDERNIGMTLRMSQEHDHGMQLCQGSHVGNISVNDVAVSEHDDAKQIQEQSACNRRNMVVTSRGWSSERQRSWPGSDSGGQRRIPVVCLQFTKGRCNFGESCRYLHGYHEYASSVSQQSKKPDLEAAANLRSIGGTNHGAVTMVAQEHDTVENDKMHLSGCKHSGGPFNEATEGKSVDDAVKQNIPDQKGEALLMDRHKCDVSAEGNKDTNLWNRPFKRQRSWSRSPSTHEDNFSWRNSREAYSRMNFPISRCYTVARFQYSDQRSYKNDRPANHMNNQQRSKGVATSANPSSCEDDGSNMMVPQGHDEAVSYVEQLDQCPSGSLDSDSAILRKKNEHESATDDLKLSHADQINEELIADSIAVEILEGTTAINQETAESDSTNSCDEHHLSPVLTNMAVLEADSKAEVGINLSQVGNENSEELTQAVKTYIRKRKRKRHSSSSKCCVKPATEQVTDASSQRLPICSMGDTSMNSVLSVTRVPDRMNTSAAKDNCLKNVMDIELPVKQKENGAVIDQVQSNVESSQVTTQNCTFSAGSTDGDLLPASQSSFGVIPNSRRKLLVLDINGLLADIVADFPDRYKPDTMVSGKGVFKRPFCDNFLQFCFDRFDVGIWSSRNKKNVNRVVDFLMKNTKDKLLFCWDQSHCTKTGYKTVENNEKPLVLKELKKLWEKQEKDLPWERGFYNETNTILLDDSPYKALRNPLYTAVYPDPYSFRDVKDKSLGPGGDLRVYLERLADAENVQKFIQDNPFGQRPITKADLSWTFYAKIIGTDASQQEGNANAGPVPHSTTL